MPTQILNYVIYLFFYFLINVQENLDDSSNGHRLFFIFILQMDYYFVAQNTIYRNRAIEFLFTGSGHVPKP